MEKRVLPCPLLATISNIAVSLSHSKDAPLTPSHWKMWTFGKYLISNSYTFSTFL